MTLPRIPMPLTPTHSPDRSLMFAITLLLHLIHPQLILKSHFPPHPPPPQLPFYVIFSSSNFPPHPAYVAPPRTCSSTTFFPNDLHHPDLSYLFLFSLFVATYDPSSPIPPHEVPSSSTKSHPPYFDPLFSTPTNSSYKN